MSSTISEIEDMHQKMILGRKSKKAVEYLNGSNFRFVKLPADIKRGLQDALLVNEIEGQKGSFYVLSVYPNSLSIRASWVQSLLTRTNNSK